MSQEVSERFVAVAAKKKCIDSLQSRSLHIQFLEVAASTQ
jgi:hypothetical protein